MKQFAPAAARNREALATVLAGELPAAGLVVEIASGSGEHAFYFAGLFPQLDWQPSDPDPDALASITAWRADFSGENLRAPIALDAAAPRWPIDRADAILCVNMVHISPWSATVGLFTGAERKLERGAPLTLYGPYFEEGTEPARSNIDFDLSLRARNEQWGIRDLARMDRLAEGKGFKRMARHAMPANNLTLVYRRI